MLSKKQALLFFLGGTILFSIIFIGLSIDTVTNGIPKHTHEENMTAEVIAGRTIWDKNNCMGCHTLMGEGAYYAPELTNVIERRGEDYVKGVLMSQQPWQPRGRKMVAYAMSEQEANDIISFFKWITEIDLNGFENVNRTVSPLVKDRMKN